MEMTVMYIVINAASMFNSTYHSSTYSYWIPTGFQQIFQKGIFTYFFISLLLDSHWTPTGLLLDSYWSITQFTITDIFTFHQYFIKSEHLLAQNSIQDSYFKMDIVLTTM